MNIYRIMGRRMGASGGERHFLASWSGVYSGVWLGRIVRAQQDAGQNDSCLGWHLLVSRLPLRMSPRRHRFLRDLPGGSYQPKSCLLILQKLLLILQHEQVEYSSPQDRQERAVTSVTSHKEMCRNGSSLN